MTLPASGAISFYDINIELQRGGTTQIDIEGAENGTFPNYPPINTCTGTYPSSANPAAINEWYGYCHTCTGSYVAGGDFSTVDCNDACTSSPILPCLSFIYNYSTTYYFTPECTLTRGAGYVAACENGSGTKVGQNCYQFNSSGALISTTQCTTTTTTTTTTTAAPVCECSSGVCTAECPNAFADCSGDPNVCFI